MSIKEQESDLNTSSAAAASREREFRHKDPYAEREARKYERPIPSRELILKVLQDIGVPANLEEVADALGVDDAEDRESLRRRLNAMERDGQLLRNRRDRFCVVNAKDLIAGRVIGHPDGFGFLHPDDGSADLFISPKDMRALIHDDRVVVSVRGIDRRGRREAAVVQVLERNTHSTVGRLYIENDIAYVVPDNKRIPLDILVPENALAGASHGQIVVVEIVEQPTARREPIGRIVEILGDHMAPGMEIEVAIRNYNLPNQWPEDVETVIASLAPAVPEEAKAGRIDLRELPLVTIDGEDARDFDDAVYCRRTPKGWKLYVAIADVSYYVRPGTALDREAQTRGTSVYFPERVIPMLPEVLSNGLCSLNPEEDRLCMVCEMVLDEDGNIGRAKFYEAVMRSHARLTYTQVARILVDGDKELRRRYKALVPHLENLYSVYRNLRRAREERGAIDFETQESRIVFGAGRKIDTIIPVVRNDAHRLIEECMIAANMATARFLAKKKVPHLLRVHEGPTAERLADLRTFLGEVGLNLGGGDNPEPRHYAELIEAIRGRPDEHLVQTVLLRSLAQAVYSPDKKGHFGLASDAYTHFTSPIRRYPDLLTHRAIKHALSKAKASDFAYSHNDLVLAGEHCSTCERRADEATRDVVSWLKCEFMLDKLGEEFDAVISAVTSFGFFAELRDIFVEGLVHISNLDKDFFHYDPIGHRLTGERSGVRYRLGDTVRVKVARVDLDERKIDLDLVKKTADAPEPRSKRRKRSRKRGKK
ncbi:RNase R [Methylococcus capsulatus]|uniref:Ribonuclease R n=1 Tax=Methylococcus capsulatus TaxID=414 RepID=A0AA35XVT5_METCP|nr:ribonuclease R [Methylococcus capsulatus]CAI8858623.1 RNase R [Methylococcus capsulatus]